MQNSRWLTDPPANDGAKVIVSDTDHYSPMKADAPWAWKLSSDDPFAVSLETGTFSARWHSVRSRETMDVGRVRVEKAGSATFEAPFAEAGPSVLHLKRHGS